jgi:BolA family transcriptional regulator, general stress-responsive regulator
VRSAGGAVDLRARIESILRERFAPERLDIRDDSARHAGHAGAAAGGGHFDVLIVSAAFEGRTLLDRHRMVNEALQEMIGREIHALGLRTLAPGEPHR